MRLVAIVGCGVIVGRAREDRSMRGAVHPIQVASIRVVPWQLEASQLLEEHHICASGRDARKRDRFTIDLGNSLSKFDDTDVCTIDGTRVHDLASLCEELERCLDVGRIQRTIDGPGGIVEALRRRPQSAGAPATKRRFVIWHEAHVLLADSPRLFGHAADAIMGVAAEHEFCSDDVLLIQRAVFVGRPALDVYAEDPAGQFNRWYAERGEAPLWRVLTGRRAPHVARWHIGAEIEAA
jgi:hypothetical protein